METMYDMDTIGKEKQGKCRYSFRYLEDNRVETHSILERTDGGDAKIVSEEDCAACEKYSSKYIEYPILVNGTKTGKLESRFGADSGKPCEVRPCGKEYGDKTYLGIYLGELPCWLYTSFHTDTGILETQAANTPAIFVPELKKIIFGAESYWRILDTPGDFAGISEAEIDNLWYVKAFRGMFGNAGDGEGG